MTSSARRLLLAALAVLVLAPAAPAAVVEPPKAVPAVSGYGGAAATVDPYATRAAIQVLRAGGNAVDATIAAAAVLGVVEPYSAGIGGGGFMVIRTAKGRVHTVDGREYAPAAFTESTWVDPATGQPIPFAEGVTSGLGVGVPGTLRGWEVALKRYGSRKLRGLLRPAITLADQGFVVDATLSRQTTENAARFADFPATAAIYLPGGAAPAAGSTLRNPELAATYRLLGRKGVAEFYEGLIAEDIVLAVTRPAVREGATRTVRPGLMTADDLADYRAIRRPPAATSYRGHRVIGMAPPSSGGSTVGEALNIMEAFGEPITDGSGTLHRMIEASRLAYADRAAYLGDPAFVDVPLGCLLSQPFAAARQQLITDAAGTSPAAPGTCPQNASQQRTADTESPSTTHLTVADSYGNVVSYTFTIEQIGGSAITVPGRGFLLNNELTDFEFVPGRPNSPAARKRPRSSMAPTIVLRRGEPVVALGSPGGSTIITTVLQVLVNRFERGMNLPAAVSAPRISQRNGARTDAEPSFLAGPDAAALTARGHVFNEVPELGTVAAIAFRRNGKLQAVTEPVRRGGGSAGVVSKRRPRPSPGPLPR